MNVAHLALARRTRARKAVADWMPRFMLCKQPIRRRAFPVVPISRIGTGVCRRPVVRVRHVTGATSARAIVSGLIVCPRHGKHWIEQSRFLQAQEYRVGSPQCPKAALTQLVLWFSRLIVSIRIPNIPFFRAS